MRKNTETSANQDLKKCPNCLQSKKANTDNFYMRGGGKLSNVCRACKCAYGTLRYMQVKCGTFVNRHKLSEIELTGKLKTCVSCEIENDEAYFREYENLKSGKVYKYRLNTCRMCEAEQQKQRRRISSLFDESMFKDITDNYNR